VHATFDLQATVVEDGVEIMIRDQGRWRPPRGQNRGRGTLLMQELMDHFEVSTGEEGTVVRMQRRIARTAALV
jgi:anti-sigma regulatory factor (Ser/Thr protein kinase)